MSERTAARIEAITGPHASVNRRIEAATALMEQDVTPDEHAVLQKYLVELYNVSTIEKSGSTLPCHC